MTRELKVTLSKEDYMKLLELFEPDQTILQVDHYFDDETSSLFMLGATLRVRQKSQKNFLQLKTSLLDGSMQVLVTQISDSDFDDLKEGTFTFPENFQKRMEGLHIVPSKLNYLGSLKTNRRTRNGVKIRGKWVLDHSALPSLEEYHEIVLKYYESDETAKAILSDFLEEHGIDNNIRTPESKFDHFTFKEVFKI